MCLPSLNNPFPKKASHANGTRADKIRAGNANDPILRLSARQGTYAIIESDILALVSLPEMVLKVGSDVRVRILVRIKAIV